LSSMSESHWWYQLHKEVRSRDSKTRFRLWQFQTTDWKWYLQMHLLSDWLTYVRNVVFIDLYVLLGTIHFVFENMLVNDDITFNLVVTVVFVVFYLFIYLWVLNCVLNCVTVQLARESVELRLPNQTYVRWLVIKTKVLMWSPA
jgi:hypothetical protein